MVKKTGLGKSFGSLLPDDFDNSLLLDKKDRIQKLKLEQISPDKNQPRKHFEESKLNELANSIKSHGILQPLVVRQVDDKYIIIAGERRFRAAGIAGLDSVPVLVRSSEELERLEIGLVENVQRVDLSPLEQAVSIAKLNEQFNLSIEEIASRLGKANSTVINIVRLLKLPEEARHALVNHEITEGHARSILALAAYPAMQKKLLGLIVKNGWSVRQAEQYASSHKEKKPQSNSPNSKSKRADSPQTIKIEKKFGAKVVVKPKTKGGEISLTYKDDKDLQRLLKLLGSD